MGMLVQLYYILKVDLHNEMNDDSNDEYDEETINQDMKLCAWEKNGPKGVMLTISCGVSFNFHK